MPSRRNPAKRKPNAGFSLLEVLIAFAAASVVLVLVLSVLPAHTLRTQERLDRLISTELAYSLLEEYRLAGPPAKLEDSFEDWSWTFNERPHDPGVAANAPPIVSLTEVTISVSKSSTPGLVATLSTVVARPLP